MSKTLGRIAVLQIMGDTAFETIGTLNVKTLTINGSTVDVTTPDASDPADEVWMETLDGMHSAALSGDGVFNDNDQEEAIDALSRATDTLEKFRLVIPGWGHYTGEFLIESFEMSGETEGGVTFSLSLSSSEKLAFLADALVITGVANQSIARGNANRNLGVLMADTESDVTWTASPSTGININAAGRVNYNPGNTPGTVEITFTGVEQWGHGRTGTLTVTITVT